MENNIKDKRKIIASFVCNLETTLITVYGILFSFIRGAKGNMFGSTFKIFRFFTVDSNLLVGIFAAILCAYEIKLLRGKIKEIPNWTIVLKFVGTVAVAFTFLVVLTFLLPISSFKAVYSGNNFIMHLLTPLVAMISFVLLECPKGFKFKWTFISIVPSAVYGFVYLIMVVFIGEENGGWQDFYWFNYNNMWPFSMPILYLVSFGCGCALWGFARLRNKKSPGR